MLKYPITKQPPWQAWRAPSWEETVAKLRVLADYLTIQAHPRSVKQIKGGA